MIDFKAGSHGSSDMILAIDNKGVAHEWILHSKHMCNEPVQIRDSQEIKLDNDKFVSVIACSYWGIYAKSESGRHYLWSTGLFPDYRYGTHDEILRLMKNNELDDVALGHSASVFIFRNPVTLTTKQ